MAGDDSEELEINEDTITDDELMAEKTERDLNEALKKRQSGKGND
jgi:hypothetical protein